GSVAWAGYPRRCRTNKEFRSAGFRLPCSAFSFPDNYFFDFRSRPMLPSSAPVGLPGLTVHELLGRGSFGAVYRARHQILDLDVAVKVIDPTRLDHAGLARALSEARLMARLDHPNLLRIFDASQTTTSVYLVLELMDGGS